MQSTSAARRLTAVLFLRRCRRARIACGNSRRGAGRCRKGVVPIGGSTEAYASFSHGIMHSTSAARRLTAVLFLRRCRRARIACGNSRRGAGRCRKGVVPIGGGSTEAYASFSHGIMHSTSAARRLTAVLFLRRCRRARIACGNYRRGAGRCRKGLSLSGGSTEAYVSFSHGIMHSTSARGSFIQMEGVTRNVNPWPEAARHSLGSRRGRP